MSSAEDSPGWAALPRGLYENGRRGAGRPVPIPGVRRLPPVFERETADAARAERALAGL